MESQGSLGGDRRVREGRGESNVGPQVKGYRQKLAKARKLIFSRTSRRSPRFWILALDPSPGKLISDF